MGNTHRCEVLSNTDESIRLRFENPFWDKPDPEFRHRSFYIAHNTGTLFEPCHKCGARYFRGPFHIVLEKHGIYCHECSAKSASQLSSLLRLYQSGIREELIEKALPNGAIMRMLFGLRNAPILPIGVTDFIPQLLAYAERMKYLMLWSTRPFACKQVTYTMPEIGDLLAPPLHYDYDDSFESLCHENGRALDSLDYVFMQVVDECRPSLPLPLRIPDLQSE